MGTATFSQNAANTFRWQDTEVHDQSAEGQEVQDRREPGLVCEKAGAEDACPDKSELNQGIHAA